MQDRPVIFPSIRYKRTIQLYEDNMQADKIFLLYLFTCLEGGNPRNDKIYQDWAFDHSYLDAVSACMPRGEEKQHGRSLSQIKIIIPRERIFEIFLLAYFLLSTPVILVLHFHLV